MTKQNNNSLLKIFNIILATLLISHAFYFNEFSYETVFNFFEGHVALLSMICKDYNPSCFMILFLSVTFLIGSLIMKTDFIKKAWFPTLMYAFFWCIYAYCYPKGQIPDITKTGSNGKMFARFLFFFPLIAGNWLLFYNDAFLADHKTFIKILSKKTKFSAYFWTFIFDGLLISLSLLLVWRFYVYQLVSLCVSLAMIAILLLLYYKYSEILEECYAESLTKTTVHKKEMIILYLISLFYFVSFCGAFWNKTGPQYVR